MEVTAPGAARAETGDTDATDYPALFRTLLLRSVENALAAIDPQRPRLDDEARERSLYALGLALDLAEAWPGARALLLTIAPYMEIQGYRYEWMDFLAKGLIQSAATGDLRGKAHAHLHLARLYQEMGEYSAADAELAEAEALAESCADRSLLVALLDRVEIGALDRGDYGRARTCAERVLAMLPDDDPARAPSLHTLGVIAVHHGEWATTIDYFHRALELRRRQGVPRFVAQLYRDLGVAYMRAGDFEAAYPSFDDAISLFEQTGDEREAAHTRMLMGNAFWFQSRFADALECYTVCEGPFVKTHDQRNLALLYNNIGLTYREFGRYDEAARLFAVSIEASRAMADYHETANVLDSLAMMYRKMGQHDRALATWQEALQELDHLAEKPRYLYTLIEKRMGETLADMLQKQGEQAPDLPA